MIEDAARRLQQFPPISLGELNEVAALQTRVDRKYLVPLARFAAVLDALAGDCSVLDFGGARDSLYESVYFDTPDLASFHGAARKRRRRFKIRTRAYLDTGACFLEVKTAGGRSMTVKDRIEYHLDARDTITEEGRAYIDETMALTGVADLRNVPLTPTLITGYRRSTLFIPSSGARATIDLGLELRRPDEGGLVLPDLAVVESKSAGAPTLVDRMLWRHGHRPVAISKYCVGLAALSPELPANRWSRVLRRHFLGPHGDRASAPLQTSRRSFTSAA